MLQSVLRSRADCGCTFVLVMHSHLQALQICHNSTAEGHTRLLLLLLVACTVQALY